MSYGTDILDGLKLIDSRKDMAGNSSKVVQNFSGPIGTVGTNYGTSNGSKQSLEPKQKLLENPLFMTILGTMGTLLVSYVVYKLGWSN